MDINQIIRNLASYLVQKLFSKKSYNKYPVSQVVPEPCCFPHQEMTSMSTSHESSLGFLTALRNTGTSDTLWTFKPHKVIEFLPGPSTECSPLELCCHNIRKLRPHKEPLVEGNSAPGSQKQLFLANNEHLTAVLKRFGCSNR